jgi:hypothetical protein
MGAPMMTCGSPGDIICRPDNPPGVGRRLVHCDAEGTIRFYALRLDEVGFIKSRPKR